MSVKAYYESDVSHFLDDDADRIIGILTSKHNHALEAQQRWAWLKQIECLKRSLVGHDGRLYLEFYIPRMGKRADALLISRDIVWVLEFKVGSSEHAGAAVAQVEDYALDLKNFHEGSHAAPIVPLLISTEATSNQNPHTTFAADLVAAPISVNAAQLGTVIETIGQSHSFPKLDQSQWAASGYKPTPTIVEAAQTLYRTHSVSDISRSDAGAKNLQETSASVIAVIDDARRNRVKSICFVTGVPGSGKTLAGLNIATRRSDEHQDEHAVFLSGNGPLVDVLREALARDKASREGITKANAQREVRSFIQNIHHFRDEYVANETVPVEKVVVFDEAQRAWTRHQAAAFMQRKRGHLGFDMSEPEFLISVMDRHQDWCTIVCLIGGGQEINTGEAGISEWMAALETRFPKWKVHYPPQINHPDYAAGPQAERFLSSARAQSDAHLHLAVSMRSFRAEALSTFIGYIVDNEPDYARACYVQIADTYPIYLTRDLEVARSWLRGHARGTERYGLVASSGAHRLRPVGIHMKSAIEPPTWFLNDDTDVRSSFYLEEVASEFDVQGLELDWAGVCWDGDFRHEGTGWTTQSFQGSKWRSVNKAEDKLYLKNAYRVILTRARQGMIIFIPDGEDSDPTRPRRFYDGTFEYLKRCGLAPLTADFQNLPG